MKKQIELQVWFLDYLVSQTVEVEYETEEQLKELADKELDNFYLSLLENSFDLSWHEIND